MGELFVGDCGCKACKTYIADRAYRVHIDYCPLHAAADEMYKALTARRDFIRYVNGDDEWPRHWDFGLMARYGKLVRAKEKHALVLADDEKELA